MRLLDNFSPAELSALRLDGEVFRLAEGFVLADEPDLPEVRIRVARGEAPACFILDGKSAAWVWAALESPPRRPELCLAMDKRGSDRFGPVRATRYLRFAPGDVVSTSAGDVLSPWRTLMHVLRWDDVSDHTVEVLLHRAALDIESARDRLMLLPAQHRRRAIERLARMT